MEKHPKNLGEIKTTPLPNQENLTFGELFKKLCKAGGWTYEQIAEALDISVDTVKNWGACRAIPNDKNFNTLTGLLYYCVKDEETENSWQKALTLAWMREGREIKQVGELICYHTLNNQYLTNLPALFETNQSLPIATAYVELRLAPSNPATANPLLLESNLSLRERLNRKIEARYAVRKAPQDLLDENPTQGTLILGAPGAGKSSLLRRLALDIANGQWNLFKIPLFVEARVYWMARKLDPDMDMLTFAVKNTLPMGHDARDAVKALLNHQKKKPFILLVDGLDEIANEPLAVNVVYEELKQLLRSISWVVTARPTGLMGSLAETQRCEVVDLDDDAIEILIDNWCAATEIEPIQLNALHLKTEIFTSPGTLEMARNPFLLTALCFLKSVIPEQNLPRSRIGVYETLLTHIAIQAQNRHRNRKILAPNILDALQKFAFSLYDHPNEVIQIFGKDHWWHFSLSHQEVSLDDFDWYILPSRLLTSFGEMDTQYHFLHLSLQEHLIARAMLDYPLEDALERRFSPGWRAVFRFYGALLLHKGKETEFRELTTRLYHEHDFNSLTLLTLAHIFSDAGISDTRDWIGEDLRVDLYNGMMRGYEAGPEAMIDALAALDPKWLEKNICSELDTMISHYEKFLEDDKGSYPGREFAINGRQPDCSYEKLAHVRTSSAKRLVADTFWGDNQNRALLASYAYAGLATPSERQMILEKAKSISMSDDLAFRFFAFAQALHRVEFIPFLGKLLNHYSETADGPFSEALNLVADIGGKPAAEILEGLAIFEANRISANFTAFEVLLNTLVRLGGKEAIHIFHQLERLPQLDAWKDAIRIMRIEADPSRENEIIKVLADSRLRDEAISALSRSADFHRIPSTNTVKVIKDQINLESVIQAMDLAFIESARLEAHQPPILCDSLWEIANHLYKRLHDINDENDPEFLKTQLVLIFDTLGKAAWPPAKHLINTIFNAQEADQDLLESTINLAGHVYAGTADITILRHLKGILFKEDGVHSQTAAIAIGRIDLEELFRLQDAENALEAMEIIATESDILIFDEFWVDRSGKKNRWKNPPKKLLYVFDNKNLEIPGLLSQELSRYGFCIEYTNPEECVGFLIFHPQDEHSKEIERQARRINSYTGPDNPLIEIPENITETDAILLAKEIGIELLARYEQLQVPSLPAYFCS